MDNIQKFFVMDALGKKVADAKKPLKAEAEKELKAGDRKTVSFDLGGEEVVLGAITRTKPRAAWKVTNEAELTAWIAENHPDMVEQVPVPKDWYVQSLLAQAAKMDAPVTEAGELVPGIEVVTGTSYASAKPEKDMEEKLARLVAGGVIQTSELLSIEGEAA